MARCSVELTLPREVAVSRTAAVSRACRPALVHFFWRLTGARTFYMGALVTGVSKLAAHKLRPFLMVAFVCGCSATPYRNEPIPRDMNAVSEYSAPVTNTKTTGIRHCTERSPSGTCTKSTYHESFVGLAISGGGSRAANFAGAVMQELSRIGVMQHVNVISSVSGGSVAAAYYVVHRDRLGLSSPDSVGWHEARKDLATDFRSKWLRRFLRPDNLLPSVFGSVGRTQYLAEVFDDTLFGGLTMGEVPADGPSLFINATAINQLGTRSIDACTNRQILAPWMRWEAVSFRDWFFNGCLDSRLDTYPLSLAVSASAAFPAVFSSVPLARWATLTRPNGDYLETVPAEFVHVIDGGPSDNLGIESLFAERAAQHLQGLGMQPDRCLIISIDAFVQGDTDDRHLDADARSPIDRFLDTNFFDSVDAMLSRRRFDTLQRLGLAPPRFTTSGPINVRNFPLPGLTFPLKHHSHVADDITPAMAMGEDERDLEAFYEDGRAEPVRQLKCMVWHIGLDNLVSLITQQHDEWFREIHHGTTAITIEDYRGKLADMVGTKESSHLLALSEISSRLRTDFNLVGPDSCRKEQLEEVIWEAGRVIVAGDRVSRKRVCDWFRETGLDVEVSCDAHADLIQGRAPAIEFTRSPSMFGGYNVRCARN